MGLYSLVICHIADDYIVSMNNIVEDVVASNVMETKHDDSILNCLSLLQGSWD